MNGIYIAAGADPMVVSNVIREHPFAGVLVYQHDEWPDYPPGRGTIENNEITGGGQFGVQIEDGADPCVRRNLIMRNTWGGIWTRKRGRGVIFDNHFIENVGSGIKNDGGRPLIGRNEFTGNGGQTVEDLGGASQDENFGIQTVKRVLWVDDNPGVQRRSG